MTVSEDLEQAVAAYYQVLNPANAGWLRLKLQGLHEDMLYQVSMPGKTGEYYGSELMYAFPLTEVISLKNQGILLLFSFLLRKKTGVRKKSPGSYCLDLFNVINYIIVK